MSMPLDRVPLHNRGDRQDSRPARQFRRERKNERKVFKSGKESFKEATGLAEFTGKIYSRQVRCHGEQFSLIFR